ncbi:sulfotransferase [Alteromonas sp. ZYF713]|nr:sulfotransferase [Alteromonas sp. ZYF713]
MSRVQSDLEILHNELAKAIELLDTSCGIKPPKTNVNKLEVGETQSLLDRCSQIVAQSNSKPKLRIIHHFACSGGTLVSKCLAALPNVFLLSELHPTTTLHQGGGKPKFLPADVTTQARYAKVPDVDRLAWSIFRSNVIQAREHIEKYSGYLVIRDHTHSDFCVGESFSEQSTIAQNLSDEFQLLRVVTLRDPIDSYISLVKNNWLHFSPNTFDEYCRRAWTFLAEYDDSQVYRYEDFVINPKDVMVQVASALELPFDDSFINTFNIFQVTGDSGRSGDIIGPRARRELTKDEYNEFGSSDFYQLIADRFNYNSMEKN